MTGSEGRTVGEPVRHRDPGADSRFRWSLDLVLGVAIVVAGTILAGIFVPAWILAVGDDLPGALAAAYLPLLAVGVLLAGIDLATRESEGGATGSASPDPPLAGASIFFGVLAAVLWWAEGTGVFAPASATFIAGWIFVAWWRRRSDRRRPAGHRPVTPVSEG